MKIEPRPWVRAPRPGEGSAHSPPARTGRIRGLWGTASLAAVMLGVCIGPSWGQDAGTGGAADQDVAANCTEPIPPPPTWKSAHYAFMIDPNSNGVVTGDGPNNLKPGDPQQGWYPGQATFHLFDPLAVTACNAAIGSGMNGNPAWFGAIVGMMGNTFRLLAILELCWAAALWAMEKEHLNSLAAEMIKKLVFIGFFYTLLLYGQTWIPAIVDSFMYVGQNVSHTQASTDGIIANGLAEVDFIWTNKAKVTIGNWPTVLPKYALAALVSAGILLGALILAAQFFMAQVESYIMLAVGAVFLGLGANSLTKDHVDKTLNYAVTVGVRLLTILIIAALMKEAVQSTIDSGWSFDPEPLARLGAVSLMQLMLALRAPEMAGALMAGGSQGAGMTAGTAAGVAANVGQAGNWAVGKLAKAGGFLNSAVAGGANRLGSASGAGTGSGGLVGAAVSGLSKAAQGAAGVMGKAADRVAGASSKIANRAAARGGEGGSLGAGANALIGVDNRGGTRSGVGSGVGSGAGADAVAGPTRARGTAGGGGSNAAGGASEAAVGAVAAAASNAGSRPNSGQSNSRQSNSPRSNTANRQFGGSSAPANPGASAGAVPALSPGVAPETATLLSAADAPAAPSPAVTAAAQNNTER